MATAPTSILVRHTGQWLETVSTELLTPGQLVTIGPQAIGPYNGNVETTVIASSNSEHTAPAWVISEQYLFDFMGSVNLVELPVYPIGSTLPIMVCLSGDVAWCRTVVADMTIGDGVVIDQENPGCLKKVYDPLVPMGYAIATPYYGNVKVIFA